MSQASGIGGQLLAGGYRHAAKIGRWSLDQVEGGQDWEANVQFADRDEYWITQRPLRLVLELGELRWSWDNVEFSGGSIVRVSGRPREGVVVKEES